MSAASETMARPAAGETFRDSRRACALVIAVTVVAALAIHIPTYLHQDVAWLSWLAGKVLGGAVYGRDFLEINPPLNMLIYVPASLLGEVTGLDLAIKLWTVFVTALSLALVWQTAERSIRLPVIIALGAFIVLGFPREFGQREQFALLFCAPYAAGPAQRRGLAILNGILAGLGFALKPWFLVPLLLVFLTRRKWRTEEWAITGVFALYGAVLLLFFRPYLTEVLPNTGIAYWEASDLDRLLLVLSWALIVPALVGVMYLVARPQKGTAGFAMAAVGFSIAVILHRKGFPYHFIPCFGFLVMYLMASLANTRRLARLVGVLFLAVVCFRLSPFTINWFTDKEGRREAIPALLAEIDKAQSFTVLSSYNYPAFPTAILTRTPFLGLSPVNNTIEAVAAIETGGAQGNLAELSRRAADQAVTELARKPDLVIVVTAWGDYGPGKSFDGLAWFKRDPRFGKLWEDYRMTGEMKDFQFYRRK